MSNSTQLGLSSRITVTCGVFSSIIYLCKSFTIPWPRLNKTSPSIGFDTCRRTTDRTCMYLMMGIIAIALQSELLQFKVFSKGSGHILGLFYKSHVYIRIYICRGEKSMDALPVHCLSVEGLRSVFLRTSGVPQGRRIGSEPARSLKKSPLSPRSIPQTYLWVLQPTRIQDDRCWRAIMCCAILRSEIALTRGFRSK